MTDSLGDILTKRVAESRVYDFDFATLDSSITTISSPAIARTKQNKVTEVLDITLGTPATQGSVLQVRISGGTDGELYQLTATADDQNSNTVEITGWLEVEEVPDTVGLTVEDGTAKINADSYVSLADSDTYWAARRGTAWQTSDPWRKEAALREATRFIDGRYTWPGRIESEDQALDWPRWEVVDRDGRIIDPGTVPQRVQDATCEAALLALSGDLIPATARGGQTKKVRLGPLAVEYEDQSPTTRSFEWLDTILAGLARNTGGRRQLMRA